MREFTEEETKAYSKALDKMYKPTGFNVFNEPCDDVVSRAEVQTALMISKDAYLYKGHPTIMISDAVQAIRELPSVRPQEQTGHWIIEVWNNKEHHTCSSCQHVVDYEPCYHYCPNCGARMVEPQESEEV